MPSGKIYTTVLIKKEIYERLKETLERANRRVVVSSFIEDLVLDNIEMNDLIKQYGPFLTYVDHNENTIFINDWKTQRIAGVRVQVKDDGSFSLSCNIDQTENCVHVGFIFALPQFYKILKEKGLSPQR